jgi:hypothetical protein
MPEGATEWDEEAGLPDDQTDAHECCDCDDSDEEE